MSLGIFSQAPRRRHAPPRGLGDAAVDAALQQSGYSSVCELTAAVQAGQYMVSDSVRQQLLANAAACYSPSTSTAPAKTASVSSGGTATGVPTKWVADARVKSMQTLLNAELSRFGCSTTLKADGLIGPATCGALQFASDAQKVTQQPWGLTAFWSQSGDSMYTGCKPYLPGTAPTCPSPRAAAPGAPPAPPAPAAVSATDLMKQQQTLLNKWLVSVGYTPIPVTGKWDPATCGAGALMDRTLPATDPTKVAIGAVLAKIKPLLGMPCSVTVQPVMPSKPVEAVTRPPPPKPAAPPVSSARSSALPPLNRDGECVINFGQKFAEIGVLQAQLNAVLAQNGYQPIPVTNVWDAATCGAMFELGGKFDPKATAACPHFYSVPLSCPTVAKPKKATAQASMMLPIGIAALVGLGALVYAKKKGLVMGAKTVRS